MNDYIFSIRMHLKKKRFASRKDHAWLVDPHICKLQFLQNFSFENDELVE